MNPEETGNIRKTCRHFGVSQITFYRWKRAYEETDESGRFKKVAGVYI